jgi:hypothetical protein
MMPARGRRFAVRASSVPCAQAGAVRVLGVDGILLRSNPFSLAEPAVVESILRPAGFNALSFVDVHEPVFYGPDVETAYEVVCSMRNTHAHETSQGVAFDSRAWIVTATRGPLTTS